MLASLTKHYPNADLSRVERAFDFAVQAHEGQKRASGEPYVTHPIEAAQILADLGIDPVAVQGELLHDVPEDTEYGIGDIEERFGPKVAQLVDGVTKLSRFSTHTYEQQQAENIRKMLLAMADDIRIVLIKLADRLHNMRTISALPAREAGPDRAPDDGDLRATRRAARASGRSSGSSRTSPSRCSSPSGSARWRTTSSCSAVTASRTWIGRLPRSNRSSRKPASSAEISGRPKHIFGIYRKMQRDTANLYDLYAIRVLVDDVKDCYAALGIVHGLWRPDPRPVRRLHRGSQEQHVPQPPHRGHRP